MKNALKNRRIAGIIAFAALIVIACLAACDIALGEKGDRQDTTKAEPTDFTYTDEGNTITITGYQGRSNSLKIPATLNKKPVTRITDRAFSGNARITGVTIPDSITSVEEGTFQGCTSLASVTIGSGVTSIGEKAFEGCTSLANITIPNSVTSIGAAAFHYCTSLTSITIPNSVTIALNDSCA